MSRKSNFKLYRVWDGIVQRCYNQKAKNYHNYGGRGITMFEPWRNSFTSFESYCLAKRYMDPCNPLDAAPKSTEGG